MPLKCESDPKLCVLQYARRIFNEENSFAVFEDAILAFNYYSEEFRQTIQTTHIDMCHRIVDYNREELGREEDARRLAKLAGQVHGVMYRLRSIDGDKAEALRRRQPAAAGSPMIRFRVPDPLLTNVEAINTRVQELIDDIFWLENQVEAAKEEGKDKENCPYGCVPPAASPPSISSFSPPPPSAPSLSHGSSPIPSMPPSLSLRIAHQIRIHMPDHMLRNPVAIYKRLMEKKAETVEMLLNRKAQLIARQQVPSRQWRASNVLKPRSILAQH